MHIQLLSVTLPARRRDAVAMLDFIQEMQRCNYVAARSYRKRRLHQLRIQRGSYPTGSVTGRAPARGA